MKKRTACLLLTLAMLLSVCVLFASCGGAAGEITLSEKVELDIKGYALVYAESAQNNSVYKKTVTNFAASLKAATGESYTAKTSAKAELGEDTPAILIGDTGAKESKKAKKAIDGVGFAIHVKDNRIAIVGSDELLTIYALQYFMDNYFKGHNGTTVLEIPEEATANELPLVTLADSENGPVPFVYSADCYENRAHPVDMLGGVYPSDMRDAPVKTAEDVLKYTMDAANLRKNRFSVVKDSEKAAQSELLFGFTNRPVSALCLQELGACEYGFFVKNGQMSLSAWNDAQMFTANAMFTELLKLATYKDEDGKVSIAFPEGFVCKGRSDGQFVTEFPKPDGIQPFYLMDTSEGALQYVYKGEGVNAATYNAYVTKLKASGYRVMMENEIEDSLFATLVNDSEKIMLYVTYNAFSHENEYQHAYDPLIRVVSVSTKQGVVTVPDASILSKPASHEKVTDTAVTAMELIGGSVGMGYIITLEDGSFVIFDGGAQAATNAAEKIWTELNARYEMIFGHKPTAEEPIRIAAWVITHSHTDHYGAPITFLAAYGQNDTWQLDYLIGNFPSASAINYVYENESVTMSNVASLRTQKNFTFLKVHTGQKYYFANLEIEVLMTYEDHAPTPIKNQNDTCTVLRFTVQPTSDGTQNVGKPTTMLWLGDANNQQSRYLCAMYGEYLESDMVQMAHHGNIGCETDLYDTVKAEVVWFPNTLSSFRAYVASWNKNSSWVFATDYRVVHENPWTKYVFVSGGNGGNESEGALGIDVTLKFGSDGLPAYDAVYYIDLASYKAQGTVNTVSVSYKSTADINHVTSCAFRSAKNFQ